MCKKISLLITLLLLVTWMPLQAQDGRQRTPETVVQDVLAQMPTPNAADYNREMEFLAKGAPRTVELLVKMLQPAEKHSNNLVEYALSGVAHYASNKSAYKENVKKALTSSIEATPDKTARQFVESLIRMLSKPETPQFAAHKGTAPYAKQFDAFKKQGANYGKLLQKALKSKDRASRVQALQFVAPYADEALYAQVAKKFKKLSVPAQQDVIYWWGDNHVTSQKALVLEQIAKAGETTPAAIEAAVKMGGEGVADALIAALGTTYSNQAYNALLTCKGNLSEKVNAAFQGANKQKQVALLNLASKRALYGTVDNVLKCAVSQEAEIAETAQKALSGVVTPQYTEKVAALLDKSNDKQIALYQNALAACVQKLQPKERYEAIGKQMKMAQNSQRFYRPLAQTGTNEAVEELKKAWSNAASSAAQKNEALNALKSTTNYAAAPTLLQAAKVGDNAALDAYLKLVNANEKNADNRFMRLNDAMQVVKNAATKKNILKGLAATPTLHSFNLAAECMADAEVAYEAALACKEIAGKCVDDIDYQALQTNLQKAQALIKAHGTADDGYAVDEIAKMLREAKPSPVFQLSEQEKKEGFEVLFDGTNLDKWVGDKVGYTPVNGTIYVTSSYGNSRNLYTAKEYRDFVLRFEFCFMREGVNNGVGIRTPMGVDAAYEGMCEVQVLDHDAPIYADLREYQVHGSAYGIIPAKRIKHKPLGEWSTEEIRVKGDRVTVTVNGEVILDGNLREACKGHNVAPDGSNHNPYTTDHRNHPGMFNKKGHIGFLGHGAGLKYRNVRIKEL